MPYRLNGVLRNARRVAIVAVLAALTFGVVRGWHSPPGAVSRQQARWHSSRPDRYSFVFHRGGMSGDCMLAVTVRDTKVTAARVVRDCGWRLDPKHAPTIDGVFSQVRNLYREGTKVEVTYNARYGFPTGVSVDPQPHAVDDEWGFGVSQFRAL